MKNRTKLKLLIVLVAICLSALILVACNEYSESTPISGVLFPSKTFIYDGTEKSIEITGTLPEGVTVSYEGNGKTDAGTYSVTAKFYENGEYMNKSISANMVISKAYVDMSGVTFEDTDIEYDGQPHYVEVKGSLPAGVTVTYEGKGSKGNGVKELGAYIVTAKFTYSDTQNYQPIPDMISVLKINKATYSLENVAFDTPASFLYDGSPKSIYLKGDLPDWLEVSYEGNGKTEVGTHTVHAVFKSKNPNYASPNMISASYTIAYELTDVTYDFGGGVTKVVPTPCHIALEPSMMAEIDSIYGYDRKWTIEGTVIDAPTSTSIVTTPTVYTVDFINKNDALAEEKFSYYYTIEDFDDSGILPLPTVAMAKDSYVIKDWHTNSFLADPLKHLSVTALANYELYPEFVDMDAAVGTSGLVYEYIGGGFAVVGYVGSENFVFIPANYYGYSVKEIADYAFKNSSVEVVCIPDSVTSIGYAAFENAQNLRTVAIRGDVAEIGDRAFAGTSLVEFSFPESVTRVPNGLFDGARYLNKVTLTTQTSIGQYAFRNTALTDLVVPDTVVAIGHGALEGTDKLESLTLPFLGGNPKATGGYLGYVFGAKSVAGGALAVPESLKTVTLSASCKTVGAYAFAYCDSITEINILASDATVSDTAFNECDAEVNIGE